MADTCPSPAADAGFRFDNSYARELEGFYVPWQAAKAPVPRLIALNRGLAEELGLDAAVLDGPVGADIFAGNRMPEGATPLAQAYAGHQFGGFSPQLGDGRALLVGEVIDRTGSRRDIQLKGSGRTPFSRGGDGKAAIAPMLREYLIGEAMHGLGIPTTRALAVVATGDEVIRETVLPGAVLARVASSHIRVGTFQFFAARGQTDMVRRLADYAIGRHYPALLEADNRYLALLEAVTERQAALVAQWMAVGFIHGVMNTDNMAISGETIDYGPCAFMEAHEPLTVYSSIDQHGRYAYANQPGIAQWNLARFAECLVDLVDADQERSVSLLTDAVNGFKGRYDVHWLAGMRAKIGLTRAEEQDRKLVEDLLALMRAGQADHTLAFRLLSDALRGDAGPARAEYLEPAAFDTWLERWRARLEGEDKPAGAIADAMDRVNPLVIARNHRVDAALRAAERDGDMAPFERLLKAISDPYSAYPGFEDLVTPAPPEFSRSFRTFCGT